MRTKLEIINIARGRNTQNDRPKAHSTLYMVFETCIIKCMYIKVRVHVYVNNSINETAHTEERE